MAESSWVHSMQDRALNCGTVVCIQLCMRVLHCELPSDVTGSCAVVRWVGQAEGAAAPCSCWSSPDIVSVGLPSIVSVSWFSVWCWPGSGHLWSLAVVGHHQIM